MPTHTKGPSFAAYLFREWRTFAKDVLVATGIPYEAQPSYQEVNQRAAELVAKLHPDPSTWGEPKVREAIKRAVVQAFRPSVNPATQNTVGVTTRGRRIGPDAMTRIERLAPDVVDELVCKIDGCSCGFTKRFEVTGELAARLIDDDLGAPDLWGRTDVFLQAYGRPDTPEGGLTELMGLVHQEIDDARQELEFARAGLYGRVLSFLAAVGYGFTPTKEQVHEMAVRRARGDAATFDEDQWALLVAKVAHRLWVVAWPHDDAAHAARKLVARLEHDRTIYEPAMAKLITAGVIKQSWAKERSRWVGRECVRYNEPFNRVLIDKVVLLATERRVADACALPALVEDAVVALIAALGPPPEQRAA